MLTHSRIHAERGTETSINRVCCRRCRRRKEEERRIEEREQKEGGRKGGEGRNRFYPFLPAILPVVTSVNDPYFLFIYFFLSFSETMIASSRSSWIAVDVSFIYSRIYLTWFVDQVDPCISLLPFPSLIFPLNNTKL